MQRILCALVALISLLAVNIAPSQAQETGVPAAPPQAVEPTTEPQEINERADASAPAPAAAARPAEARERHEVRIRQGESSGSIAVQGDRLIIEGNVRGDVKAQASEIIIRPGASVEGEIDAERSDVRIAEGMLKTAPAETPAPAPPVRAEKQEDPIGGQFGLWLLGALGGLALLVVAPRATHQMSSRVSLEPARCLIVGGIGALLLLVAQVVNSSLINSPLGLLWAPLGFVAAVLTCAALLTGWLCGMRYAGDVVARRMGRAPSAGFYGRAVFGLTAFCLLNSALSLMGHGLLVAGLMLEFLVALMGLGALLITGFGTDPEWLSRRLHGEKPWFPWGRKR